MKDIKRDIQLLTTLKEEFQTALLALAIEYTSTSQYLGYDAKLILIVRFQTWTFQEGVSFHSHYFQVHSDLDK